LEYPHRPVLIREVLRYLITQPDGIYVDGTVGNGGHSAAIAESISRKGRLICLDIDQDALRVSTKRLSPLGEKVILIKASYAQLQKVLRDLGIERVNGVFLDLGMSSYQVEESGRGFSFHRDEPLDMRMDLEGKTTAYHLINKLSRKELGKILRDYGQEKRAGLIARTLDEYRKKTPIDSSLQLANLIQSVIPLSHHPRSRHPATKTFQALRIAVNRELENLKALLDQAPSVVAKQGRLVIISYHSLEDRMVKQAMMSWEKGCQCPPDLPGCGCGKIPLFRRLEKKGVKPSQTEIRENPRARSATLRAAERVQENGEADEIDRR
jgi:16S rRNA (cytosine1402-N4)-methyltransferase